MGQTFMVCLHCLVHGTCLAGSINSTTRVRKALSSGLRCGVLVGHMPKNIRHVHRMS